MLRIALIMNIDDLLCVGAAIISCCRRLSDVTKMFFRGEVLSAIITVPKNLLKT